MSKQELTHLINDPELWFPYLMYSRKRDFPADCNHVTWNGSTPPVAPPHPGPSHLKRQRDSAVQAVTPAVGDNPSRRTSGRSTRMPSKFVVATSQAKVCVEVFLRFVLGLFRVLILVPVLVVVLL